MQSRKAKWRKFERLVAALHVAEQEGAIVRWNEKINNRQFDVTIRFKHGLYQFLTVIECKDYKRSVDVGKIDALATKARDAKADKAVLVSANGFQSGAEEVARRHNITLLTLQSLKGNDRGIAKSLSPILHLSGFRFTLNTRVPEYIFIPNELGAMRSLLRDIRLQEKDFESSPEEVIFRHRSQILKFATSTPKTYEIELGPNAVMIHPNTLDVIKVRSFLFEFQLLIESDLSDDHGYTDDPYLSGDVFQLRDEFSNTTKLVDFSKINHGIDTRLTPGKFYLNPNIGFSYYCENCNDELATMWLVEAYQHGNLFQAIYTQKTEFQSQYVEIEDEADIKRLTSLLDRLRANKRN